MNYIMVASIFLLVLFVPAVFGSSEDSRGVKLPSKCETCKFLVAELSDRFGETGKTHEVIESSKGAKKK